MRGGVIAGFAEFYPVRILGLLTPDIAIHPLEKARFCFEKITYILDYQIGVAKFANHNMMEITRKILFLITNQPN
jgi:hypothetical protein